MKRTQLDRLTELGQDFATRGAAALHARAELFEENRSICGTGLLYTDQKILLYSLARAGQLVAIAREQQGLNKRIRRAVEYFGAKW